MLKTAARCACLIDQAPSWEANLLPPGYPAGTVLAVNFKPVFDTSTQHHNGSGWSCGSNAVPSMHLSMLQLSRQALICITSLDCIDQLHASHAPHCTMLTSHKPSAYNELCPSTLLSNIVKHVYHQSRQIDHGLPATRVLAP